MDDGVSPHGFPEPRTLNPASFFYLRYFGDSGLTFTEGWPTFPRHFSGPLAQLVEQYTFNVRVGSSNLPRLTTFLNLP